MRFQAKPYRVDDALALERHGLSRPLAAILARRGLGTPEEVEEFLTADEAYDPFEFEGMEAAADLVLSTIREGRPVTIYGDFDADGVCATSILVGVVRELGGTCDWFIPDRIADGYGLNAEAIRQIAGRGTALVITVDCGVTAVEEVALARESGMEIIVTDHHQVGELLPDCPILHPQVSQYPFPSLCGAAVAAKLASALRRRAEASTEGDEADLDLVALATVADVMPLEGENRRLVNEGLKVARRARRIGLAALMEESRVDPSRLLAEDFGFRLGPRINAAGRMYRADAGVELFLADSPERAAEIARELSSANAERRRVEREVESAAKKELKELEEPGAAIVVAGEGWHPGVVGIVASHLARSEGRPAVVISLDGEVGRGSARSVPGLDLHSALDEVSGLLESFGGHAAAAGLSIRRERIEEFRAALGEAVTDRIGPDPVEPAVIYDAVAGGSDLGLDLAEEIGRLEPFGNGNPAVRLLIPAATVSDLREMGEGKHCRFSVGTGAHRAAGVAWGRPDLGIEEDERADLVAKLELNHWNGSVEPRLVVNEVRPVPEGEPLSGCEAPEWWGRFEVAMERNLDSPAVEAEVAGFEFVSGPDGHLPGVGLAELISSGERICLLTADASRRWVGLGGAEGLARFLPEASTSEQVTGLWAGSPAAATIEAGDAQVLLTEHECLSRDSALRLDGFDRLVILDPPLSATTTTAVSASGLPVHLLAGPAEFEFAERVAVERGDLTGMLRRLYAGLRDEGAIDDGQSLSGESLRTALSGDPELALSPEAAAMLLRVLVEAGLARTEGVGDARQAGVVSSGRTELSVSAVFVHHLDLHKEQVRFLTQSRRQILKQ